MNTKEIIIVMINDNPYIEKGKNPFVNSTFSSIEDAQATIENWKTSYETSNKITVDRLPFRIVVKNI